MKKAAPCKRKSNCWRGAEILKVLSQKIAFADEKQL
jgi:hypothetical protein